MVMEKTEEERASPKSVTMAQLRELFQNTGQEITRSTIAGLLPAATPPPPESTPSPIPEAEMEQAALAGVIRQLDSLGGLNIPWGSVLAGGMPGLVMGEIIDGFAPPVVNGQMSWTNALVKTGAAWMGVQFLPQWLGRQASMFFAGALALQVARQMLPVDQWVANLVGMFRRAPAARGAVAQAESIAHAYQSQVVGTSGVYRGVI